MAFKCSLEKETQQRSSSSAAFISPCTQAATSPSDTVSVQTDVGYNPAEAALFRQTGCAVSYFTLSQRCVEGRLR